MPDADCATVVRYAADLSLMPSVAVQRVAESHLEECDDCRTYRSQMATTERLVRRHGSLVPTLSGASRSAPGDQDGPEGNSTPDYRVLRAVLLERARLLNPGNAEDLTQRTLEQGFLLEQRDHRRRGLDDLVTILRALSETQDQYDRATVPESVMTAAKYDLDDSLDGLDGDADGPQLLYPDLYPAVDDADGWVNSPRRWNSGTMPVLAADEVEETDEAYRVVDEALDELPEPLGDLVSLVDLQEQSVDAAADLLSLDRDSAAVALARARNHVRGRLNAVLR